jgi:hypothetical protein
VGQPRDLEWSIDPGGRGGDSHVGFEVAIAVPERILRIVGWGLWPASLAKAYREAMLAGFRRLRGQPWAVLSDRRRGSTQSDEVRAVMSDVMDRATAMGRDRAAVLVSGAVLRLQMQRLATEAHVTQRYFDDEAEALEWLLARHP